MKIALLTDGVYPYVVGGMQKHSYYLAKYLAKNGVYVDLYHCVPYDQLLIERLESFTDEELLYIRNICVHAEKSGRYPGHYIVESYHYSQKLYHLFLEKRDVDFVYAQGFSGWYYARQKSKGAQFPPIGVNFHGLEMFQKAPSFRVKLEHLMFRCPVKRVNKLSDNTFSLGGKLTGILRNIVNDSQKVLITPIGIDKSWLIRGEMDKENFNEVRKFVFLGRYERRKGVEELSEVLKESTDSYNFEFHFIGPIPEEKKIDSDQVIYHGLIRDEEKIKKILRESDILVSPSYSEGMPTVILEAMASGCAIIATDVGAVSEEVSEENGWLIAPGDELSLKAALIDAIECSNETLTAKKIKSIAKIKENFLWDDVVQQTLDEIKQVIPQNKRGNSK